MKEGFSKRIFTAQSFLSDLGFLIWNAPKLIRVFTGKKGKIVRGKILMVTSAVNGCAYCAWLDVKLAKKDGISEEEIQNILKLEFRTNVADHELPALVFAQNFAETNGNPGPEITKELFGFYGHKIAKEIILAIRAETFGNLYFNTWGAVISRFRGKPAPKSNVIFETIYFLCNSIVILPVVLLKKLDKNGIGDNIVKH